MATPAPSPSRRPRRLGGHRPPAAGRGVERLADAGLELAVAIKDQVTQAEGNTVAPNAIAPAEAAMAFARVARAVRMTVLLHARLLKDLDEAGRREAFGRECEAVRAAARAEAAAAHARQDPAHDHKARVEAIVERVAKGACGDDEERIDRLVIEAGERLDDDDIYGDVMTRPVGELVALICRDLGLDPDWTRLAEEAWARDEIARGAAGSPFVAGVAPAGLRERRLMAAPRRGPLDHSARELVHAASP